MDPKLSYMMAMEPVMTARACGGWLATSPPSCSLRIGATGESETEARHAFKASLSQCLRTLDDDGGASGLHGPD